MCERSLIGIYDLHSTNLLVYRRDLDVSGGGGGRAAARRSRVAARVRGAQEARRPLDVEEAALETPQLEVSQAQRKLAPCLRDPGFISPNVFAPEKGKGRWRRKRLCSLTPKC